MFNSLIEMRQFESVKSILQKDLFPYNVVTNELRDCLQLKVTSGIYAMLALELGCDNCIHPFYSTTSILLLGPLTQTRQSLAYFHTRRHEKLE